MKTENTNRTRIIGLRLTPAEYEKIKKKWQATTSPKLSDYVRAMLFQKTLVGTYRNASLDEMMPEMIRLRTELNALGNNLNQAVKKLHSMQQIPNFRDYMIRFEIDRKILANKVEEIKNHIEKYAGLWLR